MKNTTAIASNVPIKNFLEHTYDELEEMNLKAKDTRDTVSFKQQEQEYRAYLEKEKRIKAITLCLS